MAGSGLHIDIPLSDGPGVNLNYVLYNPTDSECTITRGHWHSSSVSESAVKMIILVVVVVVVVILLVVAVVCCKLRGKR